MVWLKILPGEEMPQETEEWIKKFKNKLIQVQS